MDDGLEDQDPSALFDGDEASKDSEDSEDEIFDAELTNQEPLRKKATTRKRWTPEEEQELSKYFKKYLDTKTTPKGPACLKAKELSRKNNGAIYLRENHLIIKKISNINHSRK